MSHWATMTWNRALFEYISNRRKAAKYPSEGAFGDNSMTLLSIYARSHYVERSVAWITINPHCLELQNTSLDSV